MATAVPGETPSSTPASIEAPPASAANPSTSQPRARSYGAANIQVIRRNGKVTAFDPSKIAVAMTKAFLAVEGGSAAASQRVHDTVEDLTHQVADALTRRNPEGGTVHIEDIQDQVELALMRAGEHKVARSYVLYRDQQARKRAEEAAKNQAETRRRATQYLRQRHPGRRHHRAAGHRRACASW